MGALVPWLAPRSESGVLVLTPTQREAARMTAIPAAVVLGATAIMVAAGLAGWTSLDLRALQGCHNSAMFNSGGLGIALCYATLPINPMELWFMAPVVIGGETIHYLSYGSGWAWTTRLRGFGFVLSLACVAAIVWRSCRSRGDERLWAGTMLLLSLIMLANPIVSYAIHGVVITHTPHLYDEFTYRVDSVFGMQPSAAAYILVGLSKTLAYMTFLVYNELPLLMMLAVLVSLRWPRASHGHLMLHFMVIGMFGFVCYWLMPAKGCDLFVGDDYPYSGPLIHVPRLFFDGGGDTRNCYPSLHLGWMLAIYLGVRQVHPWLRRFLMLCLATMALATLSVGHYAVDLVASFAYVVAFFGIINRRTARNRLPRIAAALGGGALFVMFSLLVFHWPLVIGASLSTFSLFAALTVGGALGLERWLARATISPAHDRSGFVVDDEIEKPRAQVA
jgi:hypothetical protein